MLPGCSELSLGINQWSTYVSPAAILYPFCTVFRGTMDQSKLLWRLVTDVYGNKFKRKRVTVIEASRH